MHKFRLILIMMCIFSVVALGVTTNITVQFLVADIDNGVFDGNMTIHYELYLQLKILTGYSHYGVKSILGKMSLKVR